MYQHGTVTKDLEKAIKYLEMSKDQGYPLALLELSFIYQQPECLNYRRAYECAEKAGGPFYPLYRRRKQLSGPRG